MGWHVPHPAQLPALIVTSDRLSSNPRHSVPGVFACAGHDRQLGGGSLLSTCRRIAKREGRPAMRGQTAAAHMAVGASRPQSKIGRRCRQRYFHGAGYNFRSALAWLTFCSRSCRQILNADQRQPTFNNPRGGFHLCSLGDSGSLRRLAMTSMQTRYRSLTP
jgi:hypothetical protein